MSRKAVAIAYLDGPRIARGLRAGIRHLFQRRDYINRINVFPVPDGDTGTNLAFTFRSILEALSGHGGSELKVVVARITDAALDGARGNSGAIMAQFFQGFSEGGRDRQLLTARHFAAACRRGAEQAWTAMSEPVPGTLPTVLEDFAAAMSRRVDAGCQDIRLTLKAGLDGARRSLANTPELLPVLKSAGVVDAGGQGFVDLLEGVWAFTDRGEMDAMTEQVEDLAVVELDSDEGHGAHRYCTECVIEGAGLDRAAVMQRIEDLDCSSLVVAGGAGRIRVHVHVNNPAEVFLACEAFGELTQQKADDMKRQHGLMNQQGRVAVVVDSGADIPSQDVERLGIHIVPVRLSFGDREYLDGVSLQPHEFYRMLEESDVPPRTSQPPAGDFRRIYTLLDSHGYEIMSVGLSSELSGTTRAARSAMERLPNAQIRVFDTLNASAGQGLLAIIAAEAAAQGMGLDEIESLLMELAPQTVTLAIPDDLAAAVRGGRVPKWVKRLSELLRLGPVLQARNGKMGLAGARFGRGFDARALALHLVRRMADGEVHRVLIAHVDNPDGARALRQAILKRHAAIHSCLITEAGPALGVHLGRGGIIVSSVPQPEVLTT